MLRAGTAGFRGVSTAVSLERLHALRKWNAVAGRGGSGIAVSRRHHGQRPCPEEARRRLAGQRRGRGRPCPPRHPHVACRPSHRRETRRCWPHCVSRTPAWPVRSRRWRTAASTHSSPGPGGRCARPTPAPGTKRPACLRDRHRAAGRADCLGTVSLRSGHGIGPSFMAARSRGSSSGCRPRLARPPGAASAAYRPPLDWCLAGSSRPAAPPWRHRRCQWRAHNRQRDPLSLHWSADGMGSEVRFRAARARERRDELSRLRRGIWSRAGRARAPPRYPHHPLRPGGQAVTGRRAVGHRRRRRESLGRGAWRRASARQPAPDETRLSLARWGSSRDKQHETGRRVRADADPRHSLILTRGRDTNRIMIWTDMTNLWVGSRG